MSFENIVGNDKIKDFINKAIENKNILHSYLFIGIDGIGKSLFAKEFARKILCYNNEKEEDCISCIKLNSQNHPDFEEINSESGVIKIEQIRKLQERILEKPIISKRKVYLIIDGDAMTKEAQNCLLKTLEEPPEYACIILTANNESKLLNTIKSRCMKVYFDKIAEKEIEGYLKNKLNIELVEKLIQKSEGSIGKIIKLQQEKEIYEELNQLLENIEKYDLITLLNKAEILYKQKEKIHEILEYINVFLYNTKDIKKLRCITYVEETKKRILASSNYDMCIDYLLMKLWEEML